MRPSRALPWLSVSLLALLPARPAAPSCGAASCFLVTGLEPSLPGDGKFRLDLSYRYVEQSRPREGSDEIDAALVPEVDFAAGEILPDAHRELRTLSQTVELGLEYGVSERLALTATLPLLVHRDHEHFERVDTHAVANGHAGATRAGRVPYGPAHIVESFSGESYRGFGDVRAGARYGFVLRPDDLFIASAAIELPTGENELGNHHGEVGEPGLMPGSGSLDGLFGAYYAHSLTSRPLELFGSLALRLNSESDLDYRLGHELGWSLGVGWKPEGRLSASLQLNGKRTGRDRYRGEDVPSTGHHHVNLTPGLRFTAASGLALYGDLQLPVYQHVNEQQLAPGPQLVLGVHQSF